MRMSALLLAGLLACAQPLQAQTPRVTTEVDTTLVTVGDRITMTVTVDHPAGSEVIWPDSLDLAPFEVLGARLLPSLPGEGGSRSTLILELAAFELGDLEIPGFDIGVAEETGEVTELGTNPFGVRVTSVGLDEGGDIRDVKGPLGIPLGAGRILLVLLATILIPVLAYLIYRRLARREVEEGKRGPIIPARPPHEVALEALDRLEASPLLERGEVKEFHIQVSEILRIYVEDRFHVPALEMTTVDIIRGLERVGVEHSVRTGFVDFLQPCDMVKFAKARPDAQASLGVLALGRRLVEDTIPEADPAAPSPETGAGTGEAERVEDAPTGEDEPAPVPSDEPALTSSEEPGKEVEPS